MQLCVVDALLPEVLNVTRRGLVLVDAVEPGRRVVASLPRILAIGDHREVRQIAGKATLLRRLLWLLVVVN